MYYNKIQSPVLIRTTLTDKDHLFKQESGPYKDGGLYMYLIIKYYLSILYKVTVSCHQSITFIHFQKFREKFIHFPKFRATHCS